MRPISGFAARRLPAEGTKHCIRWSEYSHRLSCHIGWLFTFYRGARLRQMGQLNFNTQSPAVPGSAKKHYLGQNV